MSKNAKRTVTVCVDDLAKAIGESVMTTLRAHGFDKVLEAGLSVETRFAMTLTDVEHELGRNVAQTVACMDVTDEDFDFSDVVS